MTLMVLQHVVFPHPWDPPALPWLPHSAPAGQRWLGGGRRSQDSLLLCSLLLSSVLTLASPLVCSFNSIAFSVSLQPLIVQSYCCFAEFSTPWYKYDFSSAALVRQEWTGLLVLVSCCLFHFRLGILVSVFPTLFSCLCSSVKFFFCLPESQFIYLFPLFCLCT